MNLTRLFKYMTLGFVLASVPLLGACSKTVEWEEEVPLNTGEVIWVKRTDSYGKVSAYANPLKTVWGLKKRAIEFAQNGRQYKFETDTTAIMMLYQSPAPQNMVIVAWSKSCAKRGYGEFRWINGMWELQKNVSPTLIGQPRNLMGHYSGYEGAIPARVTQEFIRNSRFDLPQNGGTESHLLESRIAVNCSGRK